MSDQEKNKANETCEEHQNASEPTASLAGEDVIESPEEKIAARDQRIVELEQALNISHKNEQEAQLRARAEIDNFRRRAEIDIEKAHKYSLEKFSAGLLPVIDNLERALSLSDKNNPELAASIEGIELTLKSFLDAMKKFGVEAIDQENVAFNPDLHQAMSLVESSDHEANHVINIVQKGYSLNGRLIRPAMVIVSK